MDPVDKCNVMEKLALEGKEFNDVFDSNPAYILKRVRRYVPDLLTLEKNIKLVADEYKDKVDAESGKLLLDATFLAAIDSIYKGVREGYFSDPPGIQLYFDIGEDESGLKLYRCIRGTNSVEGSVHQKIASKFAGYVRLFISLKHVFHVFRIVDLNLPFI